MAWGGRATVTTRPVVRAARFALAHVPDLVRAGSKPRRELGRGGAGALATLTRHLRDYDAAVGYPPHQVMLGNLAPEALWDLPRPWYRTPMAGAKSEGPAGILVDQASFYGWLARAAPASLVSFATPPDRDGELLYSGGEAVGSIRSAHEADEALTPAVLLENFAAKVTGALALRRLLDEVGPDEPVDYLLGCGEEAVGDRYQRGGGNLAKAIGELAGVRRAGGADVKAFCAGPVHALILAGALVQSGVSRRVVVVAGGSLAKLGMKLRGHLAAGYPILEDVLVGVAIDVVPDDRVSPRLCLEAAAVHRIGDGDAPHQLAAALTAAPLAARGLKLTDVDRYAVELHDPDITEPAGSGNVPANQYRIIAALAARAGDITRDAVPAFERAHGLPGFSPTQGHIASAIPYLPHAIVGLTTGTLRRVQLVAKGSLFLGRMTSMGDGASVLLERNR
jgi:glycine/sarcosine/betaine reductase complex component C subunit beta